MKTLLWWLIAVCLATVTNQHPELVDDRVSASELSDLLHILLSTLKTAVRVTALVDWDTGKC